MKKSYIVDSTCNEMRIDRWIRLKIGQIPQGLIEKYLRLGKIKLNKKKIKSSHKIRTKDNIDLFNIEFRKITVRKKIEFKPSKEVVKSTEDQIIDNNENLLQIDCILQLLILEIFINKKRCRFVNLCSVFPSL